ISYYTKERQPTVYIALRNCFQSTGGKGKCFFIRNTRSRLPISVNGWVKAKETVDRKSVRATTYVSTEIGQAAKMDLSTSARPDSPSPYIAASACRFPGTRPLNTSAIDHEKIWRPIFRHAGYRDVVFIWHDWCGRRPGRSELCPIGEGKAQIHAMGSMGRSSAWKGEGAKRRRSLY